MEAHNRRRRIIAVAAFTLTILLAAQCQAAAKDEKAAHFTGKVTPLADVLKKQGVVLDADVAKHWLGLITEDGKVYLLIKNDGSRMFFKDARLLNRPMRLTGRLLPRSNLLQVAEVHSYLGGKLHELYYWCDNCAPERHGTR